MENNDLSESDVEFWAEFDKQVILQDKPFGTGKKKNTKKTVEEKIQDFMKTVSSNYYKERLQKLISQVRIASQVQFEAKFAKAKVLIQEQHAEEISQLKFLHRDQIILLRKEFSALEAKLIEKDKEISNLERCLIEQEKSISSYRINKDTKYSEEERVKEILSTMTANKIAFDMQMGHMKELVSIYKKEADQAILNLKSLQVAHNKQLIEFAEEKTQLLGQIDTIKSQSSKQIQAISQSYEVFKVDVDKELSIRSLIHKRQTDFIEILKKELKSAKMIMETPRLNAKYLTKIGKVDKRASSLNRSIDFPSRKPSKIISLGKRTSMHQSSFSTSATPMYTNASDIDLNPLLRFVDIPEDEDY